MHNYTKYTFPLLILVITHCGTKKDSSLKSQYDSLSTKIDSLNNLVDSISKRSDSIHHSIIYPEKTAAKEVNYNQIRQDVDIFNEKYRTSIISNNFPSTPPITIKDMGLIVGYGEKYHPLTRTKQFHKGIDIPAIKGELVTSTISGYVELAEMKGALGKHLIISSGSGIKIHFAHLDSIFVNKGDNVEIGQKIGRVGNTGLSTRSHLHYEISINDESINPIFTFFNLLDEEDTKLIFGNNDQSFD